MQVVSQLEMHLQKERDRLQAMMHHLYLTKHFGMSDDAQVKKFLFQFIHIIFIIVVFHPKYPGKYNTYPI